MSGMAWTDATAQRDVPEDDVIGLMVDGHDIALYKADGEIYATANICTHGQARLCDGFFDGHEIECPLHQGRFDVRSGKALRAPVADDIRTYPVKTEGGRVYVALE